VTASRIHFQVDPSRCTGCEGCVADCPIGIIERLGDGIPSVSEANQGRCLLCQHCLAVCPQAAVSVGGLRPDDSRQVQTADLPNLVEMEALVRARRSFRQYQDVNVDQTLIRRLLDATTLAPTGANYRQLTFTVIEDKAVLARVRDRLMTALADASAAGQLPADGGRVAASILSGWRAGRDVVFRGAPHLLIVSSPPDAPCAQQDVAIALSYFELLAQSAGLGTVWCGYLHRLLALLPANKSMFPIPRDHAYYPLLFGAPAVQYPRAVQRHASAAVSTVTELLPA
jgi:nitroreductase/NAD-dependent dihydropyrimidine dehydrogenase PreA subunit